MKELILVMGFSGVGKSTLISEATKRRGVESYHIATPFKDMMRALWGVDVDDREIRRNHRPNGRENVGELMASAFKKFREWDPDILIPGFLKTLDSYTYRYDVPYLLIDGVRTLAEVITTQAYCKARGIPLTLVHVTRTDVDFEKWPEIAGDVSLALDSAFDAARETGGNIWRVVNDEPDGESWENLCNYTPDRVLYNGPTHRQTIQESLGINTEYRYGYYILPTMITRVLPSGKVDVVYPVDPRSDMMGPGEAVKNDYWYKGKTWDTMTEALSDLVANMGEKIVLDSPES